MIGRNKRGIRRASTRARLAVAAAVLVGGGAAGVVALAASHGSATTAQSAGYTVSAHRQLSETQAVSSAMNGWDKSPSKSLSTLAEMTPMRTFNMTPFHSHMLALQRGTVVAAAKNEFVIKSSNHRLELWHVNRGTKLLNVGGNRTGMAAMTGGTMAAPAKMNMKAKGVAKGDLVFIFGERVHGELVAQLVLFAAPLKAAPTVTPSAMPSTTTTPTMTATPTITATPTMTATPSMAATPEPTHF